jgi:hypothetical protein
MILAQLLQTLILRHVCIHPLYTNHIYLFLYEDSRALAEPKVEHKHFGLLEMPGDLAHQSGQGDRQE